MWESGRNNKGFGEVDKVGTGVNKVFKARPQAPAPAQRANISMKFETPGLPTGTATGSNGVEICNRYNSNNPMHTAAAKTMTCVTDFCDM